MDAASRGRVLEVHGLTKRFGAVTAVQDLSFTVRPGRVTGFLGPNGAGKTTTLRCLLGLVTPTAARPRSAGVRYVDLPDPQREVGALLEARASTPGAPRETACASPPMPAGVDERRVDAVLELVGLDARPRTGASGEFSLGMRQRLGLAQALLADRPCWCWTSPPTGWTPRASCGSAASCGRSPPRGARCWCRATCCRRCSRPWTTSIIVARGRLVRAGTLEELAGAGAVRATTPSPAALVAALADAGIEARAPQPDEVLARGTTPAAVGHVAFPPGVELHGLAPAQSDLETIFLRLVDGTEHCRRAARPAGTHGPADGLTAAPPSLRRAAGVPGGASRSHRRRRPRRRCPGDTLATPRSLPLRRRPGLGRLVATELLKLRTTRVWWGLLLTGILLAFLNSGLLAGTAGLSLGNGRPSPPPTDPAMLRSIYTGGFANGYIITLCLGVLGMAGEYRHQTITPTLLAVPARGRLVVSKLVAYLLAGLAYGVVLVAGGAVLGAVSWRARVPGRARRPGVVRSMLLAALGCAVWAVFGLGSGRSITNQIVALLTAIGFAALAGPLLGLALDAVKVGAVAQYLPNQASAALVQGTNGGIEQQLLPWWGGALVLLAYGVRSRCSARC